MMRPFPINVADTVIDELHARIRRTRWPATVAGTGWSLGADTDYLDALAAYWLDEYDWRAQERMLNEQLPGWLTTIDGKHVHFGRCVGRGPDPMPLLLLHGWPGSFFEMYKIAPMLADPGAYGGDPRDAFEVIVPSLPGHGFSDAPLAVGFGADECADVMHALMTDVLGFDRGFVTQGGDRGAFVSAGLGRRHRPSIIGVHLNMATGIVGAGEDISADELRFQRDQMTFLAREGGYIAIQGTRPQTLGVGLNDSPVGLLAWIVEKWFAWSDCNGDIESCFTKDELLTNVMIYWITQTIRPSMHYYYEHRAQPPVAMRPERVDAPTAVAMFPREVMQVPRSAVERKYDLRRWTQMERGGHFAAMEQPDALVADIRAFCREFR
ncbi:MAG TPA: epoxide hydrolase [Acidimicrobiales bacterium]|nr:epoxide hydrolase [Acidimicrobiales bacterium]